MYFSMKRVINFTKTNMYAMMVIDTESITIGDTKMTRNIE